MNPSLSSGAGDAEFIVATLEELLATPGVTEVYLSRDVPHSEEVTLEGEGGSQPATLTFESYTCTLYYMYGGDPGEDFGEEETSPRPVTSWGATLREAVGYARDSLDLFNGSWGGN